MQIWKRLLGKETYCPKGYLFLFLIFSFIPFHPLFYFYRVLYPPVNNFYKFSMSTASPVLFLRSAGAVGGGGVPAGTFSSRDDGRPFKVFDWFMEIEECYFYGGNLSSERSFLITVIFRDSFQFSFIVQTVSNLAVSHAEFEYDACPLDVDSRNGVCCRRTRHFPPSSSSSRGGGQSRTFYGAAVN